MRLSWLIGLRVVAYTLVDVHKSPGIVMAPRVMYETDGHRPCNNPRRSTAVVDDEIHLLARLCGIKLRLLYSAW